MLIDKKTHSVSDDNYYKTKSTKTQIVIGGSLRANSNHIIRLNHKDFGKTKKWCTYTITREGVIFQHYDNKYYSDYLGIKNIDTKIISIVLENMGALAYESGRYLNWVNEECEPQNVVGKKILGFEYWEGYSELQMESLRDICLTLCKTHKIPNECIDFSHYNKEIGNFKGIAFKSNYFEDNIDINPLFNIRKFNEMLSE